ncbi:MAG: 4-hydroxyphenylpyruvate dioxygenase [Kofleriaceae bacterium]|nr:MAG: 4-hydroxyphenylpyruvate dioxygenase [Kofleriaceae bacterium]
MTDTIATNPCALEGIDFVELAGPEPDRLHRLLVAFGFSRTQHHPERGLDLYEQGDMTFLLHRADGGHAARFAREHGPCIPAMGWRVADADAAAQIAAARGATLVDGDLAKGSEVVPAIDGIGGSLIYLMDGWRHPQRWARLGFVPHPRPVVVPAKGFRAIDHLTNNVPRGTLGRWASFYKDIFGFTEVRYFDIRGVRTGLTSFALRSPCGTFCIPINEGTETQSQIDEYLAQYNGPGIQHLAFLTDDILASLRALDDTAIETLDIDDDYYATVFDRVPGVREDRTEIRRRNVLVDGDADGYLLQIFTRNLIGPIFIEIIQRRNHLSFGEGNFGALFRSIERDQQRRGVFDQGAPTSR